MVTRRTLLGATAGVGTLVLAPAVPAGAAAGSGIWDRDVSANGWSIDPATVGQYRVEGSGSSMILRHGYPAAVLLHIARRWHYEIAALDTGEGGEVTAYTRNRRVQTKFESNYLSGTAIALHPTSYPLRGSESLWPHHVAIVRDILVDCEGTVVWGGDLSPIKASHFQLVAGPGDKVLRGVAARLDTRVQTVSRSQTAGVVADPATPARRRRAAALARPR